jgi:hypothetical protein
MKVPHALHASRKINEVGFAIGRKLQKSQQVMRFFSTFAGEIKRT